MDGHYEVLTWGCSPQDDAEHTANPVDIPTPTPLEALSGQDIIAISCINYHSLALTRSGRVWGWGRNTWGQCGVGRESAAVAPTPVAFEGHPPRCVQVDCGGYHSLALTAEAEVYAWGRNTFGQLGLGTITQHCAPMKVPGLARVVQVRAGRSFSVALNEEGQVYSWGLGVHGQLGQGSPTSCLVPTVLASLAGVSIALVQCGNRHCCALADDGEVYFWGQGLKDQMFVPTPTPVATARDKEFRRLECGGMHTLALTAGGQVYSWGDGACGQLGHSGHPTRPSTDPRPVVGLGPGRVAAIATGFFSSFALTEAGDVYAWGSPSRLVQPGQAARLRVGQALFGVEPSSTPRKVPCLSQCRLVALACGYDHYVALAQRKTEVPVPQTLRADLMATLNDPTFADTTLVVDGREVHCHRVVLACRCPHFARMFSSGMQEAQPPYRVQVADYKYPAFYAFLEHLYGDRLDFPTELCLELLDITHAYSSPTLQSACTAKLMGLISLETVTQLFATADQFRVPQLKEACLDFIVDHLSELTTSDGFGSLSKECYLDILKFASSRNLSFERRIPMPRRGVKRRALPLDSSDT